MDRSLMIEEVEFRLGQVLVRVSDVSVLTDSTSCSLTTTTPMPSSDRELVYINNFCFCRAHGSENCNICCFDFRMGNNYMIEDQLSTVLPGMTPDTLFVRSVSHTTGQAH